MVTSLIFFTWCFLGFIVFALLHRIDSWPHAVWFGWLCFFLCGPWVWLFFALMWIKDK